MATDLSNRRTVNMIRQFMQPDEGMRREPSLILGTDDGHKCVTQGRGHGTGHHQCLIQTGQPQIMITAGHFIGGLRR